MHLDSYDCELCILQKEETLRHLFIKCPFARRCWEIIGITYPTTIQPIAAFALFKKKLKVNFAIEIIIIMAWSIWNTRNDWIFEAEDPTVEKCRAKFIRDFSLLLHRARNKDVQQMRQWLQDLM